MGPGRAGLHLNSAQLRLCAGDLHGVAPFAEFDRQRCEQPCGIVHLKDQHPQLRMSPHRQLGGVVSLADLQLDASAEEVEPLSKAACRRGFSARAATKTEVSGTNIVEVASSLWRVGGSLVPPTVRLGQMQVEIPIPSHHGRQVAAANRHRLPRGWGWRRVDNVIAETTPSSSISQAIDSAE